MRIARTQAQASKQVRRKAKLAALGVLPVDDQDDEPGDHGEPEPSSEPAA